MLFSAVPFSAHALADVSEELVNIYTQLLLTPEGIAGFVLLLSVPVTLLIVDRFKWFVLAIAIHLSTYTVIRTEDIDALTGILDVISRFSQPVSWALLIFMLVPTVRPYPWRRSKLVHGALIALLILQVVISLRRFSAGYYTKALGGIVLYCLMFFILGIGLARGLADMQKIRGMIRAVSGAAALTVAVTLYLIIVHPGQAMASGRIYGATGNPQHLAAALSLPIPYLCALIADRSNTVRSRILSAVVTSLCLLLILGTGSRMGALLAAVGLILFFRAQLGAIMVGGTLILAFSLLGYQMLGELIGSGEQRVFTTANTRGEVFQNLFEQFLAFPITGTSAEGAAGESSYLSVAAGYGIMGVIPMLVMLALMIRTLYRTVRNQRLLAEYEIIANLVIAATMQLLVAWFVEAFLIGTFTPHNIILYCTMMLFAVIEEQIRVKTSPEGIASSKGGDVEPEMVVVAHGQTAAE